MSHTAEGIQERSPRHRAVTLRATRASLVFSWAVFLSLLLCGALVAVAYVLREARDSATPGSALERAYEIGMWLPIVGIVFTVLSLIAVLYRRGRTAVKVTHKNVRLPRAGTTFLSSQLARVQVYTLRDEGTFLVLLPEHAAARQITALQDEARAYTARVPDKPNHQPFEFVELIRAHYPHVAIDKWGTVR